VDVGLGGDAKVREHDVDLLLDGLDGVAAQTLGSLHHRVVAEIALELLDPLLRLPLELLAALVRALLEPSQILLDRPEGILDAIHALLDEVGLGHDDSLLGYAGDTSGIGRLRGGKIGAHLT
jgi:hypothetical protein